MQSYYNIIDSILYAVHYISVTYFINESLCFLFPSPNILLILLLFFKDIFSEYKILGL